MPPDAVKLLERMRRSKAGWKRKDLDALYKGFGFEIKHGGSHDIVTHPDYPQLRETLPRHTQVKPYLVRRAVKIVEALLELQATEQDNMDEEESENDE